MNNNSKSRNKFTHLYNPSKEGLGSYDLNYINAYRKGKKYSNQNKIDQKRYAAWFHLFEVFQS